MGVKVTVGSHVALYELEKVDVSVAEEVNERDGDGVGVRDGVADGDGEPDDVVVTETVFVKDVYVRDGESDCDRDSVHKSVRV